jgi:anti-anti-sigma factor
MTATVRTTPTPVPTSIALSEVSLSSVEPRLLLDVFTSKHSCVVRVAGELDLATRNQLVSATTAGSHHQMVIDLGGVTFMDCSGYAALVDARHIIERQGRSLTIAGETGQPARLLCLIAELDQGPVRPPLPARRSVA